MKPPYQPGEPVRYLVLVPGAGTCLLNGTVTAVTAREDGRWRIDTVSSEGADWFLVDFDGDSDYISAGHHSTCVDCGQRLPATQTGSIYGFTWRGPRSELVHNPPCTPTSTPTDPRERTTA